MRVGDLARRRRLLFAFFSVGFVLACQRFFRALAGKAGGKVESATN